MILWNDTERGTGRFLQSFKIFLT